MRATVLAVEVRPAKTYLAADVAADSSQVLVYDGAPFRVEGAQAVIGGTTFDVLGVQSGGGKDSPDLLSLAGAVPVEVEAGEPVEVLPVVSPTVAEVQAEETGQTYDVVVGQAHQSKVALTPGVKEEPYPVIELEVIDGVPTIVNVEGRGADDASMLEGTLPEGMLDDTPYAEDLAAALEGIGEINEFGWISARLVEGDVIATATEGQRMQLSKSGLAAYDENGDLRTAIDAETGRLFASDGTFSGSLVGGAISIAQGTAATLDENFETASGTTPPAGWTRQVIASGGTAGDVDFQTSGGNPGRRLRLRTAQLPPSPTVGANRITYPTDLVAADVAIEFDYRWTGVAAPFFHPHFLGMVLRADPANPGNESSARSVRLHLLDGRWRVDVSGQTSTVSPLSDAVPPGAWVRMRFELRGSTISIQVGDGVPTVVNLNVPAADGKVVFQSSASAFWGETVLDQTVSIDNVHIEALQTGLQVDPDGKTTLERLKVNASAEVPDPLMPLDAVNLRTMQDAISGAGVWVPCEPVTNYSTPASGDDQLAVSATGRQVSLSGLLTRTTSTLSGGTTQTAANVVPEPFRPRSGPVVHEAVIGSASNRIEVRVNTDGSIAITPTNAQGVGGTVRINMTWGRA